MLFVPFAFNELSNPQDQGLQRGLAELGLSTQFYAVFQVSITLLVALVYIAISVLLFWRKSSDRMAIITAIAFMTFGVGGAINANTAAETLTLSGSSDTLLRYLYMFTSFTGFSLIGSFPFFFPDGRLVPPWSILIVLLAVVQAIQFQLPPTSPLSFFNMPPAYSLVVSFLVWGGGAAAQLYRYRRVSSATQRQQTKWFVYGFTILMTLVLISLTFQLAILPAVQQAVGRVLFEITIRALTSIAYVVPTIAIAFSMFRYRLWDIDFVINRSLVYGGVTLLLAAVFGLILFVISQLTQGNQNGIAFAGALIGSGALFQPARRRLQRVVDQKVYGIEIEYQKPRLASMRPAAPSNMTTVLKDTHFGAYKDLQLVGKGGMAEVYRANHPTLNRPVAIKILPAALVDHGDFRQRFMREAQIVAKLEHPNIVRVFDYGETGGTHYMVMEFIAGKDLGEHLKVQPRFPLTQALPILRDIASALDYAHLQSLVHRDIKPSNVMLDTARAVLTDFGIARMVDGKTAMTRSGVLGTLDYMSPEQIQEVRDIDGRVDVYALGIVAYQMLTGELPFKHQNPGALLIAHLTQPAPDPRDLVPDLPREAAHAIRKALAKQPNERYATAGEFVAALG
ncbi:MAG: serine/threonine-protein kinase [Anaerolineae bacterium]